METYDELGEIENEGVWFQLKANENVKIAAKEQAIAVRMEWRDLLFWMNERMPGILVVFDANQEKAWWLHLQEAVRTLKPTKSQPLSKTATLHIPLTNVLDQSAVQHFAELRDNALRKGENEP